MNAPEIRRAKMNDARELARLAAELGYPADGAEMEQRLARILSSPSDCLVVAGNPEGGLAGWAHGFLSQLIESGYRLEIGGLIVDGRWRRLGLGTRLVRELESWAVEHGAQEISVRCQEKRLESHRFYERLAFRHVKTQKVFRKSLRAGS